MEVYDLNIRSSEVDFRVFFEWFKAKDDEDPQIQMVKSAISQVLPEFKDFRLHPFPLSLRINRQGQDLDLNQLSLGERCLIALVGDLARRLTLASSLAHPAIVLIDELELHLSPIRQETILARLEAVFPNCQFIITTTSPVILSSVQPESIHILGSTPEGIIVK
jgi:regulator of extracellular matrix RemA (YlzA/DUF370 family)